MGGPSLPEELLSQVMWHLRSSIVRPIRGLRYGWCDGFDEPEPRLCSEPVASAYKKQRHDRKVSRRTLASCMQANRALHRIAQPVFYETVDVDQLLPFVQACMRQPGLAGHVRELHVSGQNGYFYPERPLCDSDGNATYDCFRSRMLAHGTRDEFKDGHSEVSIAMMAVILCANLEKLVVDSNAAIRWVLPASLLKDCAALSKTDRSTHSRIPLSNLRTFAIQAPTQTDQLVRQESAWWNDGSTLR